jgi:Luciferase
LEIATKTGSLATSVLDEVTTWPGISTRTTSRGATAIVFEGHELGDVHPNRGTLDMPLPEDRRTEVLNGGQAKEWFPGWVSKPLATTQTHRTGSRCCAKATTSYTFCEQLSAFMASPATP